MPSKPMKTTDKFFAAVFGIMFIAAVGHWLFGEKEKPSENATDQQVTAVADAHKLNAEQLIKFDKPYFACITLDKYKEAMGRNAKGEETKLSAMFNEHECIDLPANLDFKVLSVISEYPETATVEITVPGSGSANGFFTEWKFK